MYSKSNHRTGRERFYRFFSKFNIRLIATDYPFPRFPGLLSVFPAIIIGCTSDALPAETSQYSSHISVLKSGQAFVKAGSTLDILTFEDNKFARLDSYQRIEDFHGSGTSAESTGGEKIFFLCANSHRTIYDWAAIRCYSSLSDVTIDLEKEKRDFILTTGQTKGLAGWKYPDINMKPAACEIVLETISCDFSGTPYSGYSLTDVKVYLINVNATCRMLQSGEDTPMRIINSGQFCHDDLKRFPDKSILVQDISGPVGKESLHPDIRLLCYPNHSDGSSPGAPPTRLVIEGKVGTEIWYWPINVGAESMGPQRGCSYRYDILIRRKGTDDPDIPVENAGVVISARVRAWKDMEEYSVHF